MSDPVARTERWLHEIVIGMGLCPFARRPAMAGQIHVALCDAQDRDAIVEQLIDEIDALLARSPAERATTLVVASSALGDFDAYLDVAFEIEAIMEHAGLGGVLQLATFHPDYLFEGEPEDALSHYTNRAPYPTFHLLREQQVSEAIQTYPDVDAIPAQNVARLERLGREAVEARWRDL